MPAAMHSFYLRKMYQENKLAKPGGIELKGVPIDLRRVSLPVFILGSREDHIAPWKAAFAGTRFYSGPTQFCLAASGHIAGVVNPPAAQKYCYWTGADKAATPDEWLAQATQHAGSWWPIWQKWIAAYAGEKVPARVPGEGKLKTIEAAPGSYVRVKSES
jgi:polyhydroxyalkanoate synthase